MGPQGLQGEPGAIGPQGPAGPTGPQGEPGPAGTTPKYANIVVVAKSGGDFDDPIAAINSLTDASSSKLYLVKIMPGIYDLGTTPLSMKSFIDIEGSGKNVTVLKGSVATFNGNASDGPGLINGANNSELRNLSVSNNCSFLSGAYLCIGVYSQLLDDYSGATSALSTFVLSNVYVKSEGGVNAKAVSSWYSSFTAKDSSLEAVNSGGAAYGIACYYNFVRLARSDVKVTGNGSNYGMNCSGWGNTTVTGVPATFVEDSKFIIDGGPSSSNFGVIVGDTTRGMAVLKDSMIALNGGSYNVPLMSTSRTKCIDLFDGEFNPLTCQ